MIPDFPHNIIRIRLAQLIFFWCILKLLCLCHVGCLSSAFLNWDNQQGRDLVTSGSNKQNIQFGQLYYEESLVSSNLNSKLVWFYSVRPNVHTYLSSYIFFLLFKRTIKNLLLNSDVSTYQRIWRKQINNQWNQNVFTAWHQRPNLKT